MPNAIELQESAIEAPYVIKIETIPLAKRLALILVFCLAAFQLAAQTPSNSTSEPEVDLGELSFGTRNEAQWKRMRTVAETEDGEFLMVNLMKFRARAKYADGRETNLTGEQANALYSPIKFIGQIGGGIEYVGRVNDQIGNLNPRWDEVGIVRYPSRAKFFEMLDDPEFEKRAVHKDAGLEVSQVLVTERVPWKLSGSKRIADQDDAFIYAQLLKYRKSVREATENDANKTRAGQASMEAFDAATETLLQSLGAKPLLKTRVKGTLIGDGRSWDEFRMLQFPSVAAYETYSDSLQKMPDAVKLKEAAIEESYVIMIETMPLAKRLALSMAVSAFAPQEEGDKKNKKTEGP
ncbi:MAG: hypothetical protein AAGG48_10880 [Planctomycetota bacterium]